MNDMPKEQGSGGQGAMKKPNMDVLKGLLSIIFGIILIALAYKVIVAVLLLLSGLILIYYGLEVLKITWATKSIDEIIKRFRGLLHM